jgi:NHL repeat-containing protein
MFGIEKSVTYLLIVGLFAVNNQGDIYITDTRNSRVQVLHVK